MQMDEMANIPSEDSKLPTAVFIDDSGAAKKHSMYYIKVFPKGKSPGNSNGVELSVEENPMFRNHMDSREFKLKKWELECVTQWIRDNLALLRLCCEGGVLAKQMLLRPEYKKPRTKLELRSMRDGTSVVTDPAPEPVAESFLQCARRHMLNKQRIEFGLPPLP